MDTHAILDVALEAAQAAGAIIRSNFGKAHRIAYKGAVDPVTETDTTAEAVILRKLRAAFPDYHVLAEESGGSATQSDTPLWIIDPLDGTNNFAHNFPHVAVSIALWEGGAPLVGVITDPLRDDVFAARRGAGATHNGDPIHVTGTTELAQAFLATGFPYARRTLADNNTRRLDHFLRRCQGVRRAGAAVLDLAYVACGRFDGFWEPDLKAWDMAAGILLIQEAGGTITTFTGDPISLTAPDIVASNGHLHAPMLQVIREGDAAPRPASH